MRALLFVAFFNLSARDRVGRRRKRFVFCRGWGLSVVFVVFKHVVVCIISCMLGVMSYCLHGLVYGVSLRCFYFFVAVCYLRFLLRLYRSTPT